jgi:hypothetical protein
MATAREEELLCLIEVMKSELFLMGQICFDAQILGRCELRKLAQKEDVEFEELLESVYFQGYDETLEKTVERVENIIRLAEERVQELSP